MNIENRILSTENSMRMQDIINRIVAIVLMVVVNGCIVVDMKGAGVFRAPIKYDNREYIAYIDIPPGIEGKDLRYLNKEEKSGSKIGFTHLGNCGGMSFNGVVLPIIPIPYYTANTCEKNGFRVSHQTITDTLGVTLQLHYNGITHDPYIDKGSIKFKIENFSEFKKAEDKTLIIHKRQLDGAMWIKEIPFDWKIVTEVSGGL